MRPNAKRSTLTLDTSSKVYSMPVSRFSMLLNCFKLLLLEELLAMHSPSVGLCVLILWLFFRGPLPTALFLKCGNKRVDDDDEAF
jgi:hypothetical protein